MGRSSNDDRSDAFNPTSDQYWANLNNHIEQTGGDYDGAPAARPQIPYWDPPPRQTFDKVTSGSSQPVHARSCWYEYLATAVTNRGYLLRRIIGGRRRDKPLDGAEEMAAEAWERYHPYHLTISLCRTNWAKEGMVPVTGTIWERSRAIEHSREEAGRLLEQLKFALVVIPSASDHHLFTDGFPSIAVAEELVRRRLAIRLLKREFARRMGHSSSDDDLRHTLGMRMSIQRSARYWRSLDAWQEEDAREYSRPWKDRWRQWEHHLETGAFGWLNGTNESHWEQEEDEKLQMGAGLTQVLGS